MPHGLRASGSFSPFLLISAQISPVEQIHEDSVPSQSLFLLVSCLQCSAYMSPPSRLAVCPLPPPVSLVTLFVSVHGAHCDLE